MVVETVKKIEAVSGKRAKGSDTTAKESLSEQSVVKHRDHR